MARIEPVNNYPYGVEKKYETNTTISGMGVIAKKQLVNQTVDDSKLKEIADRFTKGSVV